MSDKILKYIFKGDSDPLERATAKGSKAITSLGKHAQDVMGRMNRTATYLGNTFVTPLTALAGGAGLAMTTKSVIDFDARLARLAMQAEMTRPEMRSLKRELQDIGLQKYAAPTDLLSGMEQIISKTGDIRFAKDSLKDLATISAATGSEMDSIGATASQMMQKFALGAKDMIPAFDIIYAQGKAGAFELKDVASQGEEIFTAAARVGMTGIESLRKFGAFVQVAKQGTSSPAEAATAVKNTITQLVQNEDKIRKMTGFNIWDPEKSKKAGRHVMKDIDIVLKEIIGRTKGDAVKLQKLFDIRAMGGVGAMAAAYNQSGNFDFFDRFIKVGVDGQMIMKDFAFWSGESAAQVDKLKTVLSNFANDNLAGPIKVLTSALTVLNNHPLIAAGGIWTLLLGAGTVGAFKLFGFLKGLKDAWSGTGRSGASGSGGILGTGRSGPIPVYIVNKHLSMMPGEWGGGWKPGEGGGIAGKVSTARDILNAGASKIPGVGGALASAATLSGGTVAAGAGALAAGYAVGTAINKGLGALFGLNKKGDKLYEGGLGGWIGEKIADMTYKETAYKSAMLEAIKASKDTKVEANTQVTAYINLPSGQTVQAPPGAVVTESRTTSNIYDKAARGKHL